MKTLVLGASEKTDRYSNRAVRSLLKHGHEVIAVGARIGEVEGVNILTGTPALENIDTITIYLNPGNQLQYYDYILSLHPRRIILNPGAENSALEKLAVSHGIEVENACTLVLLATEQY